MHIYGEYRFTVKTIFSLITHRHSIAELGGCLQRHLFVCQFLCLHNNFQTIQLRMIKLGGYVHCTKILPEFECQGQRSKVKVTGDKNEKVQHLVWESSSRARHFASSTPVGMHAV